MVRIGKASADARRFDRETIRAVSDVWDNNTLPLFWAAGTADTEERERRALTVLEWMAGHSERRRGGMAEEAAAAGYESATSASRLDLHHGALCVAARDD